MPKFKVKKKKLKSPEGLSDKVMGPSEATSKKMFSFNKKLAK